ncbi:MAG TPA: STAS/SEC14 domain-containing protein [Acidobacteriaceae bacterium]|nr:STAS/SEC14 domain-containing protein [Acidobacteriaceae bacterium]
MIETLKESHGPAFGFKVIGTLTAEDVSALTTALDIAIAANGNKPMGVLADLTTMHGATWAARWDEMHFLRHHNNSVARLAIVSESQWEEAAEMAVVTAGGLQAEARYYGSDEISHAWHWVRMHPHDNGMPVRIIQPGTGLFSDYTPEYVGI